MKWTLLAAAALVLCCGLPFRTHETRTLLPVQTVQAERTEAGVRIVTEAGEGSGATWDDAVAALRMAAPGEVYFDTAGQVVLCGRTAAPSCWKAASCARRRRCAGAGAWPTRRGCSTCWRLTPAP